MLTHDDIDLIANDGMRNAAGGIYATRVYEFAYKVIEAYVESQRAPAPPEAAPAWDASQIKQPGWQHVAAAFVEGARDARLNPQAIDEDFKRAADGYTKRVFEDVDPVSEQALRTESWADRVRRRPLAADPQRAGLPVALHRGRQCQRAGADMAARGAHVIQKASNESLVDHLQAFLQKHMKTHDYTLTLSGGDRDRDQGRVLITILVEPKPARQPRKAAAR